MCRPNGCLASTETSLGAPPPLNSGARSKESKTPGAKTRRGNEGVLFDECHVETNTCRKGAGGATAPLLRAAHGRLRLWRRCSDTNCQRERSCCGDADRCGARIAPELAMAAARATGHPRRTAARGGGQGRQPGTPPLSRAKNPALAGRPVLGPCRIRPASQRQL